MVQELKLDSVLFVRRYPVDLSVRKKVFDFEDRFKPDFPNPAQVFNVAENAPPNQARFMLAHQRRQMAVSANSAQLTLNFSEGRISADATKGVLLKYAEKLDGVYSEILTHQQEFYSGLVLTFIQPSTVSKSTAGKAIAKAFMRLPGTDDVDTCSINFSKVRDAVFYNFEASVYATIIKEIKQGMLKSTAININVDPDFENEQDFGIQIKIDVNTKPTRRKQSGRQFVHVLERALTYIDDEISPFVTPDMGVMKYGH